jgi:hypothetical protein
LELFRPEPVAWIQQTLGPGWESTFGVISLLGGAWGAILAAGLALWLWGRRGLYVFLAVLVAEAVAKKALAALFSVPRPEGGMIVKYEEIESVSSFPSGHTSSAAALFAALGGGRKRFLWLGLLVGGAVGLARLYLGVHWVADVVAGVALGLGLAWLVGMGAGSVHRTLGGVSSRVEWGVGLAVTALSVAAALWLVSDNAFAWRSVGFTAALGLAVPAERSWVGWDPDQRTPARRRLAAWVGGAGVAVGMLSSWLLDPEALRLQGALAFLGTLWVLLAVPALFSSPRSDDEEAT